MQSNPTSKSTPCDWHGKPYYSLDAYCKNTFGEKLYKIALNAGLTCPNRDGTLDTRGCIFCSEGGSGDFAESLLASGNFPVSLQKGINRLSGKQTGRLFIAYFQAYTNTYGPLPYLKEIFEGALSDDRIAGISIATRPDCLASPVLALLKELKSRYPRKFIWIELGLQTVKEDTVRYIRRGFSLDCFESAVDSLTAIRIPVIVHLILGLPGETVKDMLSSVSYLNALPVWGIKLQLLHILKDTGLAEDYLNRGEAFCSFVKQEDYIDLLIECLGLMRPDMVVHRLTGDAPKDLLLAPLWSSDKRKVLNTLHQTMKIRNSRQSENWQE